MRINSLYTMLRLMVALFITTLFSCENNRGITFDISKNSCKDENNPRKVHVNLTGTTLNIGACGAIESIVTLDSTQAIGAIDKIQVEGDNIYILDKRKA